MEMTLIQIAFLRHYNKNITFMPKKEYHIYFFGVVEVGDRLGTSRKTENGFNVANGKVGMVL